MSNYFKEVEFEDTLSPADQRPEMVVVWDEEGLKDALKAIQAEIAKIKVGTSEFTHYAINPSKFGFPAENAIKVFVADPSDRTFEGIEAISKQDLGALAGKEFVRLLREARKEVPNERN